MSEIKTADCMKRKENKAWYIKCKDGLAFLYMSSNNRLVTNCKNEVFGHVVDIGQKKENKNTDIVTVSRLLS